MPKKPTFPKSLYTQNLSDAANAAEAINRLREIYSSTIGYDYDHLRLPDERAWLREAAETRRFRPPNDPLDPIRLLEQLTKVEAFEHFLHRIFPGKTRFSVEGLDMMVPMLDIMLGESADAGIYAMAALVYEIIDLEPNRIKVEVIPGISAFQAAAAKAGAMIGHDFCCISLSDLLTPWDAIEKRVKAAAEGDFVISFYNPRSLKRRDQLERAFAILKSHRPPDTPVVIASNLGRPQENVRIVSFANFNPDEVDMLTLVMVGSSQSKSFARRDGRNYAYTPRGYAKKRETP